MKKLFTLFLTFILMLSIITQLISCGSKNFDTNAKSEYEVLIHYYDGITRTYTVGNYDKLTAEILAPSGNIIIGLFDESGVQYATNDCIVDKWKSSFPTTLYAKYEEVTKTSYTLGKIGYDEDPKKVSFYSARKTTWDLNSSNTSESKITQICECNPYSDVTITVTFMGKGKESHNGNTFKYKVVVGEETIAYFTSDDLGDNYNTYTLSATIKAKQLINSGYEIKATASSNYGYEDYMVKNYIITLSFDFN